MNDLQDNDVALLVLSSPVAANSSFLKLPTDPAVATTLKPAATTTGKPMSTTKSPTACSCTCPTTKPAVVNGQTTKKPAALLRAFSTYTNVTAIIAGWGTTSSGNIFKYHFHSFFFFFF